jgi:excisionase family DNA binding protein
MAREYLTCEEAGALLGRSGKTVRRWAADPDHPLQGHRFGPRHLLFRRSDVEALRASAEPVLRYPDAAKARAR